jgi:hypothetical protein
VFASVSARDLIATAGAYDLAFAVFHLCFPLVFRWRSRLAKLDPVNRGIVHTLNLMLAFLFAAGGAALGAKPDVIAADPLGRGLLFIGAGFWLLRAALQPVMFGLRHWASKLLFVVFIAGAALHAAPAWP